MDISEEDGLVCRQHYLKLIETLVSVGQNELARQCIDLAVKQMFWSDPLQRPEYFFAGMPAKPAYDPADFAIAEYLERHYTEIRRELDHVDDQSEQGFHPVEEPLLHTGSWDGVIFYEGGHRHERACTLFPRTSEILGGLPKEALSAGVVMLSRLEPRSHIVPHCGYTNGRLRIHLALTASKDSVLRVKDQYFSWEEGRCLVFDDSFEHEVWHYGEQSRVVLLFDIFHPDLTNVQQQRLMSKSSSLSARVENFMLKHGLRRIARDAIGGEIGLFPNENIERQIRRLMWDLDVDAVDLVDGVVRFSSSMRT